jgi:formylmethanofuran dehydrogenase subunit E
MMKRRTIVYFDPEALEILDKLRGLTPKSMFINYQIKQLGKPTTTTNEIDQTKTHERIETEAPKTIPEKRSDVSDIKKPSINKKVNQDMIICPQCHKKNILTNRNTRNRRCSYCDFNIKNEMFDIVNMEA